LSSPVGTEKTALSAPSAGLKVNRVTQNKLQLEGDKAGAIFDALPKAGIRAALIGSGIQESRTPTMHMAEGARLGLDYVYTLIDFDKLGLPEAALQSVLELAAVHGFAGLNVTHPFKESIVPLLDQLSTEAAAIGAVNTVVFREGRTVGHNTDCWGFAESFRSGMKGARLDRVLLIGAGGAGKAVAWALRDLGAQLIDILDLDHARSADLARALNSHSGACRARAVADAVEAAERMAGVVNTTPLGMAKYPGMPLPAAALRPDLWVADIVYFPAETEFMRAASAAGCRILPGKRMAVFQAVKAFELITGCSPDREEMFKHFALTSAPARQRSTTLT
jgi:shikimate dehydrogenase